MGNVVNLFAQEEVEPGPNGTEVLAYIRERIDFEFSDEVYIHVDRAVARVWNDLPVGADFGEFHIVDAIRGLRAQGILFSEAQTQLLASLMLEALASGGYVA